MSENETAPVLEHRGREEQTKTGDSDFTLLARHLLVFDAVRDSRLARTDVAVLMAILEHLNRKTGFAFPSLDTIAVEAKVNRRTAIRSIERLVEVGHLIRVRGSGRRANGYRMPPRSSGELTTTTVDAVAAVAVVNRVRSSGEFTTLTCRTYKSSHPKHGASAPERAISITDKSEKLEAITRSAISKFNAKLAKPAGALDVVNEDVGFEVRVKQVRRVLGPARDICRKLLDTDEITPEFWELYFGSIATDAFLAGSDPARRVKPSFATYMDAATLVAVFDRQASL